jgi:hypothetical protein
MASWPTILILKAKVSILTPDTIILTVSTSPMLMPAIATPDIPTRC